MRPRRRTVSQNDAEFIDNSPSPTRFETLRQSSIIKLTKTLNEHRKQSYLCDFEIKIGDELFPVHKIVLASSSRFFAALFNNKKDAFIENSSNCVEFQDVSPESAEQIITYMYTGEIDLDANNVHEIAKASNMYELSNLFVLCLEFMCENIDLVNAIGLLCVADFYESQEYKLRIKRYIETNFSEVCVSEDFKMLPEETLKSFLRSENLSILSEVEVLIATLNWFAYNETSRIHLFREFIGYLRMPLISSAEMHEIRHMFQGTKVLRDLEELLEKTERSPEKTDGGYYQIRFQPRFCSRKRVFVVGGMTVNPGTIVGTNKVKTILMAMDAWRIRPGPDLLEPVAETACAILGDYLYAVGGLYERVTRQSVQRLNIREKDAQWEFVAPLINARHSTALIAYNNKLYAFGGSNSIQPVLDIEVYDPVTDVWQYHGPLPHSIVGYGAVHHGHYCYFISNASTTSNYQYFVKYHIENRTSTYLPFWHREPTRSHFAMVAFRGCIYVLGGLEEVNKPSKAVNVYNIENSSWHVAASMRVACGRLKAFTSHNHLYVLNACGKNNRIRVEAYDPATNTWFSKSMFQPALSVDYAKVALAVAD